MKTNPSSLACRQHKSNIQTVKSRTWSRNKPVHKWIRFRMRLPQYERNMKDVIVWNPVISFIRQQLEREEIWWSASKLKLAGKMFVCSAVCLSVRHLRVNHSSVCVSISKPLYLPNSHLISLYQHTESKQATAKHGFLSLHAEFKQNVMLLPQAANTEENNRINVLYSS